MTPAAILFMRRAILSIIAVVLLLGEADVAQATTAKIVAFGDSITFGCYDDNEPASDHCKTARGYPYRLGPDLAADGWNATVVNAGLPGETTTKALSSGRIDDVVAGGGDLFYLMEGTNDITAVANYKLSVNTVVFNIGQLAQRAEAAGYHVALATIIPREPQAKKDADNAFTKELNDGIRNLASSTSRELIDVYDYLLNTVAGGNLSYLNRHYYDYYYQTWYGCTYCDDPVGHPDGNGYDKLVIPFRGYSNDYIAYITGAAIHLPAPATAGAPLTFTDVLYRGDITSMTWDFGDGGRETVPATTTSVDYVYREPGTYTVELTWTTGTTSGTVSSGLTVGGTAPSWIQRATVVPLAFRGTAAAPDDLRFDLSLQNDSAESVLAEISVLPEPLADEIPLPMLAASFSSDPPLDAASTIAALREGIPKSPGGPFFHFVAAGTQLTLSDLLAGDFDAADFRGSAVVTFWYQNAGSETSLSAAGAVYEQGQTPVANLLESDPTTWTNAPSDLSGIAGSATVRDRVALTSNSATDDSWVTLHLFDGSDTEVASTDVGLPARSTTTADLEQLFPGLSGYTGPFRVRVDAPSESSVACLARAVEVDESTGAVTVISPP